MTVRAILKSILFALLLTVSVMAKGGWDMSAAHAVTTFFMCTGGGTLGGMLS